MRSESPFCAFIATPALVCMLMLAAASAPHVVCGFATGRTPFLARHLQKAVSDSACTEVPAETKQNEEGQDVRIEDVHQAVRAPLSFIGPYPTLALRFPKLATSNQRASNATGISLDFVLDTAANTNTINAEVAKELQLEVLGSALPGVGSAGPFQGGNAYLLGDSELEKIDEKFTFMEGLTASSLPVASPAAAGLLSLAFLQCFDGVEFYWGNNSAEGKQPAVTFFSKTPEDVMEGLTRVSIQRIPVTQLPVVTIRVNGVDMPALLDTGSPITVFNAQAAEQAGIETMKVGDSSGGNPFSGISNRFAKAQAASRGDILQIMGTNGLVELVKSADPAPIQLPGADGDQVDFGSGNVYVGEIPGLKAMESLSIGASPAVILGMDVLRRLPQMLLCMQDDEVWF